MDHQGFEQEMDAQRARARAARQTELSMGVQSALLTDIKVDSRFVGYDSRSKQRIISDHQDEALHDSVSTGEAKLIFAETPFYAEMGGQVADTGTIVAEDGTIVAEVTDVKSTERSVLAYCYNQSATTRRRELFLTSGSASSQ